MYLKILLNAILGYVNIEIEGYFIERFINICNSKNIFLWNLKRTHSTRLLVNISVKDFKKLKPIAKKTKCRVKIQKRRGLPFLLHRYKKRKIFFILFIFIIILAAVLSNFIWNIEITGNETIQLEEIKELLNKNDFKIGKCKIGMNTKEIVSAIRLERDDIAWVGIELNGTNAKVEIVEADKKPDIIKDDEYCNLIATKDGMIVKVVAQNGTPVVKEGDVITKGSILVGGWLEGKFTGMRYVHANGEVQAKVWYSEKVKQPLKELKKEETGATENKYSVKINNFEINFSKGVSKFEKYDTIEAEKKLKLFSNFYLPIALHTKTFKEYKEQEVTYSVEEAKQMAINKAKQKLDEKIENINNNNLNEKEDNSTSSSEKTENINEKAQNANTSSNENTKLDEKIYTKQTQEYIEVEVVYEMLENIATKEKIVF